MNILHQHNFVHETLTQQQHVLQEGCSWQDTRDAIETRKESLKDDIKKFCKGSLLKQRKTTVRRWRNSRAKPLERLTNRHKDMHMPQSI